MKLSRFFLLGFVAAAVPAYAMNAPDDMKVYRIQENALLTGLPAQTIALDAKKPRPDSFQFFFGNNGTPIPASSALDENITSLKDPRLQPGRMTCTITTVDNKMPGLAQLERPAEPNSYRFSSASGATVALQRVTMSVLVSDRYVMTRNTVDCFRVGSEPITTPMLRAALGPRFNIVLSDDQAQSEAAKQKLKGALSGASHSLPAAPKVVDDDQDLKTIAPAAPSPADDAVVGVDRGDGKSKVE